MKNIKIGPKLIVLFLAVGLLPMAITGMLSMNTSNGALETETADKLTAIRQIKKNQIESWFGERFGDARVIAAFYETADAVARFDEAYAKGTESDEYKAVHAFYHPIFEKYEKEYGYYDVFLISPKGDVVYTVEKEPDYATNLANGKYRDTSLAEAYKKAMAGEVFLTRFEAYAPSNGDPASFIAAPIVSEGNTIGVAAMQIPMGTMNKIMQERSGLGESGETYLVGHDYLMRSDSRFEKEPTVLKKEVRSPAVEAAFAGKVDCAVVPDYRNIPVWSCYDKINVDGLDWVILAEIDEAEAGQAVARIRNMMFLVLGICAAVVLLIAVFFSRSIAKPIGSITETAKSLALGNLNHQITVTSGDEIGELGEAFKQLIEAQQDKASVAEEIAKGNLAVNVEILSKEDTLGKSMDAMKQNIQNLIGQMAHMSNEHNAGDIDVQISDNEFHGAFKDMAKGVNEMVNGHIAVKKKAMACVAEFGKGNFDAPLEKFPGKKAFINDTIETMRSNIKRFITDMNTMSREHDLGDIDVVIPAETYQGAFREMAAGVNGMVNGHIAVKKKAMACIAEFGKGNFEAPLEKFPGKKAFINDTIEGVRGNLRAINKELLTLIDASRAGRLSVRGDHDKFAGDWAEMIAGVNDILDSILNPINEAAQVLDELADYNLTARVQGNYQGDHAKIKNSLNATATALHDSMSQVAEAADQVSSASTQIASSSQQVAEGTSEQASALEETSSALEEMAGMTKQNADNTQQAKGLAESTRAAAVKGASAMTNMLSSMDKIKSAAEGTAAIIKDINDIAFQTNLLALNAAVEAARAGDAGRGFAVVAEEVRNLAGRAKEAAKNTEDLIKESVRLAVEGQGISGQVNENLSEIVGSVGKVTDIVAEIAVASQEQARGIEQVNKAVTEMDKVVQQSAANSEESSSAAEELAGQSQEMAAMVGKFKLNRASSTKRPAAVQTRKSPPKKPEVKTNGKRGGNGHANDYYPSPGSIIPMESDPDFAEF